jgi:hypothetical protein
VQAGAAFGGPIKRTRRIYYFSYEITRRHETGFSSIGQDCVGGQTCFGLLNNVDLSNAFGLPPGTIQQGVNATSDQQTFFSSTLPAAEAALAGISPALAAGYGQEAAVYATFVGGSSGTALNGSYPQIFGALAGTAIPIPPNGTSPLTQFPTSCNLSPNLLCNSLPANFLSLNSQTGNFPVFEGTSLYSLRIDHNINNNNRLTLHMSVSPSTITGIEVNGENQVFGQNAYSRTSEQTNRDLSGVLQETWTLGSNKVNELRFQFARRGNNYSYNTATPAGADVAENIPGVGYFGREPYSYVQRVEKRYQFTDNFSWTIGRHDTKFGGDFNYIPLDATFTVNYGGLYDFGTTASSTFFSNICTANSLPATLCPTFPDFTPVQSYGLGWPNELVQGYGGAHDTFSNKPLGLFWQDSWRASPTVTLNYGLRYDVEFPPHLSPLNSFAQAAYNQLGLQKGINTDTNNFQPRLGVAWDPKGDGKTVLRASYGIFYDHPLLALYFLGDASDGSQSGQLLLGQGAPCSAVPGTAGPGSLNAINTFQGTLNTPTCLPTVPGYIAGQQRFNTVPFTPAQASNPQYPGLFVDQNYLQPSTFFPLAFQPFGYPQAKNFVYAYAQQANFSIERDLGGGFDLNLAYNFNGGRHLNRPINANTTRGDLVMNNYNAALTDPTSFATQGGPLGVGAGSAPCGVNPTGQPSGCVPFSDMDANYSNGSSIYHGFSANLRKRLSRHYELTASYTLSHAIDDATDLQATLTPQDSFYPNLDRSTSTFDQRHRFVFSGVYNSGHLSGDGFASRFFSNWTVAPLLEIASGRPFNIITGDDDNLQLSALTGRPNTFVNPACVAQGYPAVMSKYSPTGAFQEVCPADFNGTLLSLDGNLGRNAGLTPWVAFGDMRFAKRVFFGERYNLELITDIFNIANRFNVASVNVLFTNAGQPTSSYDPRQFQFAMKLNW